MRHLKSLLAIVRTRVLRLAALGALIFVVTSVIMPPVQKAFAANSWQKLSQAELTVIWWQWVYSIPASDNPLLDDTGASAYVGQPYSDLLFLAGSFLGPVTRNISVKHGTALFFPLVNIEWDNVCNRPRLDCDSTVKTHPQNLGVPKLKAFAANVMDSATGLFAMLSSAVPTATGCSQTGASLNVGYARLLSPHPFPYTLPPPPDNLYGDLNIRGTVAPAVGDGFYSLTPGTLVPGDYMLKFGGSVIYLGSPFTQDITYCITVTP
jgi:hypothetical protein